MSRRSITDLDIPTIEIISTTKAKERAAKQTGIPFSYGNSIETYDLVDNEIKHVHVDLSKAGYTQKRNYHKLLKKYKNQEFKKFLYPLWTKFITVGAVIVLAASAFGLSKCLSTKRPPHIPSNHRPVMVSKQKVPTQPQQNQNVKE